MCLCYRCLLTGLVKQDLPFVYMAEVQMMYPIFPEELRKLTALREIRVPHPPRASYGRNASRAGEKRSDSPWS